MKSNETGITKDLWERQVDNLNSKAFLLVTDHFKGTKVQGSSVDKAA